MPFRWNSVVFSECRKSTAGKRKGILTGQTQDSNCGESIWAPASAPRKLKLKLNSNNKHFLKTGQKSLGDKLLCILSVVLKNLDITLHKKGVRGNLTSLNYVYCYRNLYT